MTNPMKKIKIFVAGSKELEAQRNAIKSVISDLNTEYEHLDVSLKMYSYENYSDNQTAYNKFIVDESDMVLFILEGEIRSKTEEEFLIASKEFQKSGRPEISIFVNKSAGEDSGDTPQMNYVKGLLKGSVDKYYKNYTDKDDYKSLKDAVKQCIRSYINDEKKRKRNNFRKSCRRVLTPMASVLLCLFALAAGYFYYEANKNESLLLIAGGGSARNYIDKYYMEDGQKIENFDFDGNYIYLHMGSKDAWTLLREEFIYCRDEFRKDASKKRYYPVCLSAAEIEETKICNSEEKSEFLKGGKIVGVKLGEDTLKVYATGDIAKIEDMSGGTIPSDRFQELIVSVDSNNKKVGEGNQRECVIYTTSGTSGTLASWKSIMGDHSDLLDNRAHFSDIIGAGQFNDKNTLILGSELYKPQIDNLIRQGKASQAYVKINGGILVKPVYLYFIVYSDNGKYVLPQETFNFLEKVATANRGKGGKYEELNTFLDKKVGESRVVECSEKIICYMNDVLGI